MKVYRPPTRTVSSPSASASAARAMVSGLCIQTSDAVDEGDSVAKVFRFTGFNERLAIEGNLIRVGVE